MVVYHVSVRVYQLIVHPTDWRRQAVSISFCLFIKTEIFCFLLAFTSIK